DLQAWQQTAQPGATRSVIVQLAPGLTGNSIGDLFGSAKLMGDYKKLGMVAMIMTSPDLSRFAADARILALTPDRAVVRQGTTTTPAPAYSLLQTVTGADQASSKFAVTGMGIG